MHEFDWWSWWRFFRSVSPSLSFLLICLSRDNQKWNARHPISSAEIKPGGKVYHVIHWAAVPRAQFQPPLFHMWPSPQACDVRASAGGGCSHDISAARHRNITMGRYLVTLGMTAATPSIFYGNVRQPSWWRVKCACSYPAPADSTQCRVGRQVRHVINVTLVCVDWDYVSGWY